MEEVGIPAAAARIDSYPHEFSGGMRQRVVIALALAAEPELVIADEPTTALDVSVQAQVIAVLKRLCRERGTAVMLITHDMGVIAETADRVAVMYAGRIAEIGPVRTVIKQPHHPYTVGLMGSIPTVTGDDARLQQIPGAMPRLDAIPAGCAFNPRCTAAFDRCRRDRPDLIGGGAGGGGLLAGGRRPRMTAKVLVEAVGLSRRFDLSQPWLARLLGGAPRLTLKAVQDVSFSISRGETLALVGESGSGKSTIARLAVGLLQPSDGAVLIDGIDLADPAKKAQLAKLRRRIQMIFQDPFASLNPRWRVDRIVAEPIRAFRLSSSQAETAEKVAELLRRVGLDPRDGRKFPHEFSGGQRQRICIARALASEPEFIVCDEPTSALDVSVQAQILNLMKDLQDQFGLTYLFISHNLAVVRHMASRIGVVYLGRMVELAPARSLFRAPRHPYTRMLLDALPDLEMTGRPRRMVEGEIPSPIAPPPGCAFHPRCPLANDRCRQEVPQPLAAGDALVACHAVEEGRDQTATPLRMSV